MTAKKLYQAVHSAVLHDWDPIGVENLPEAQGEYDAYVPKLCDLLKSKTSRNEILAYLWWLETEQLGLSGNRQRTEVFADNLSKIASEIEDIEKDK